LKHKRLGRKNSCLKRADALYTEEPSRADPADLEPFMTLFVAALLGVVSAVPFGGQGMSTS
jgi:hypothetical protein